MIESIIGRGHMGAAQHHYVTSAYLDGFLAAGETMLCVYTRDRSDLFRAKPDKVARIRNYYSQERKDGTIDDTLEKALQQNVEDPGLAVIRKLNSGNYNISRFARQNLSLLLAIQEYRVPWMRDNMQQLVHHMHRRFTDAVLAAPGLLERHVEEVAKDRDESLTVTAQSIRNAFASGSVVLETKPGASLWAMSVAAEKLSGYYYGMKWAILHSADYPFVTSDCPVHKYYVPLNTHIPFTGVADPRVQVRFPLSKNRMLVLSTDFRRIKQVTELLEMGKTREAERRRDATSIIEPIEVSKTEVMNFNEHTISMASRIVLAPIEMPEIPPIFRGECKNVRVTVEDFPDGLMKMSTLYSPR